MRIPECFNNNSQVGKKDDTFKIDFIKYLKLGDFNNKFEL